MSVKNLERNDVEQCLDYSCNDGELEHLKERVDNLSYVLSGLLIVLKNNYNILNDSSIKDLLNNSYLIDME